MELPRRRGVLESEKGERDKGTVGKMLPNRAGVFDNCGSCLMAWVSTKSTKILRHLKREVVNEQFRFG